MPRATHDSEFTKEFPLEALDEAVVTLRQMTYGERTKVREMSMELSMQASKADRKEASIDVEMTMAKVDEYEFATSIVDHNLEDAEGNKLNFKKAGVVGSLRPEVGTEISLLITRFNNPEEDPKAAGS